MKQTVIIVAAHKPYPFPEDPGYLPLHAGRAISPDDLRIQGDNTGENISTLNHQFCELTGLYWLWKNVDAKTYGLVHYRRYFRSPQTGAVPLTIKNRKIARPGSLAKLAGTDSVVVPAPRRYYIETVRNHYRHAHHLQDLDITRNIIATRCPGYLRAFDQVMKRRSLSLFNMFVMPANLFHHYCPWLFGILFDEQKSIPFADYGPYQRRVFGFLAERLFNVWLEKHVRREQIRHLPVVNLERENLPAKAVGLLRRKFSGVKPA